MVINKRVPEVRGDVLRKAREAKGLSVSELATKACFSVKQIEQLENGQKSHFYSLTIKAGAAKKVAQILDLNQEDVFDFGLDLVEQAESVSTDGIKDENPSVSQAIEVDNNIKSQEPQPKVEQIERFIESAPKPKKKSYAPMMIGVVVLVAVALLLNINPPNTVSKTVEPVKLPSETIANSAEQKEQESQSAANPPPASAPVSTAIPAATVVNSPSVADACPSEDPNPTKYRASIASKPGNMIYVQTRVKQTLCIKDALGKMEKKTLDEGGSYSFYGKPPFVLLSASLGQTEIFFQGYKVRLDNPSAKTIVFEEISY